MERKIKELDRQIKEARRATTIALTLEEKLAGRKQINSLSSNWLRKTQMLPNASKPCARRRSSLPMLKTTLDAQVANQVEEQLKNDRTRIAAEEAKKAKLAEATDFEQKVREVADLQEVLKSREEKLAEAQKAQADLIKKQRELDDAKRELELTIEKRVQVSIDATRPSDTSGTSL